MDQVTVDGPGPAPGPGPGSVRVEGPSYMALQRRARALLVAGCALSAAAGAFALSAFEASDMGARLSWSGPITLLLLGGMAAGYGAARVQNHPFFQNIGILWALVIPLGLLAALLSGVGSYATALTVAAFAAYGCEAKRPWGPNLLLSLPLVPAVVHATFYTTDGGLLRDALEAAGLSAVALLAYETARLGEAYAESWEGLKDGEGRDALTRAETGNALALSFVGATVLTGTLAVLVVGILYWKQATVGRTGFASLLGDPTTAVPVLLALLALALVGLLALIRGRDEPEA